MTVTLTVEQVDSLTGADCHRFDITLAASLLDRRPGTPPPNMTTSGRSRVVGAGCMGDRRRPCPPHVDSTTTDGGHVGDAGRLFVCGSDVGLARSVRLSNVCDGRPQELLNLSRARWAHI